jgi:hypothetical protein
MSKDKTNSFYFQKKLNIFLEKFQKGWESDGFITVEVVEW